MIPLPPVKNEWVKPHPNSKRAQAIRQLCPNKNLLRWYPEIPSIGSKIWAVWRSGITGVATYMGAWTYKRDDQTYINELPVAWSPHIT